MTADERPSVDEETLPETPPDAPRGVDDDVTAAEQRAGDSLSERLAMEQPDRPGDPAEVGLEIVDLDGPDAEPELVGDAANAGDEPSAEEAAMRVSDAAPGATDDDDDGYVADDGAIAP